MAVGSCRSPPVCPEVAARVESRCATSEKRAVDGSASALLIAAIATRKQHEGAADSTSRARTNTFWNINVLSKITDEHNLGQTYSQSTYSHFTNSL